MCLELEKITCLHARDLVFVWTFGLVILYSWTNRNIIIRYTIMFCSYGVSRGSVFRPRLLNVFRNRNEIFRDVSDFLRFFFSFSRSENRSIYNRCYSRCTQTLERVYDIPTDCKWIGRKSHMLRTERVHRGKTIDF